MRNRAKCKLCETIIESFHGHDYIECQCKHISIDGGSDYFRASAIDFRNFLRIDDQGNEIEVKFIDPPDSIKEPETPPSLPKLTKQDKIKMIDEMIKSIENLPPHAMQMPASQYDHMSMLILLRSVLED